MKKKVNEKGNLFVDLVIKYKVFLILIILMVALGIAKPVFFSSRNIMNVLRQVVVSTIAAVGFTFILAIGCIDLSVGSQLGLTGVFLALMLVAGVPTGFVVLLGIVIAVLLSLVNAAFITFFKLPPFIVTLATSSIYRGACYVITQMKAIRGLPDDFTYLGQGYLFGIPFPVYVLVAVVVVAYLLANKTVIGRHIIGVGGNAEASRVCGINVERIRYIVYGIMGACVGIAAILQTARSVSAQVAAGQDMEMDSIAAVVIGGTSMNGGNANIIGTVAGCLIVGVVSNGLNLLGVDSNWQVIAKGLLILFAVVLDSVSSMIVKRSQVKRVIAQSK